MTDVPSAQNAGAVFDPQMFPHGRRTIGQLILDHNPCFLLSTLLMLLGCYLLNGALDVRAGDSGKLFGLIGVINVYEVCIIALGLLLVRRRRSAGRDGLWLLLFETLFLVDGTFLIAETVEADAAWGWAVNLVLLVLAIAKGLVIVRGMRVRLGARTAGFLAFQLAVVYGMPILLQRVAVDGVVSGRAMYVVWWVVGMLPVAYELLARLETRSLDELAPVQQALRRAYVIIPWLLAVAHVGFMHWAYHADFYAADLAPVFLGIAVASLRVGSSAVLPASNLSFLRVTLPVAALIASQLGDSSALEWTVQAAGETLRLTPGALTFAAALIAWGYFVSWQVAAAAVAAVLLAAGAYVLRAWLETAYHWLFDLGQQIEAWLVRLLPQSAAAWGIWAIAGAFVLLAVGGLLSLWRDPVQPAQPPRSDVAL
jgi:hypothetical protein